MTKKPGNGGSKGTSKKEVVVYFQLVKDVYLFDGAPKPGNLV